MLLYYCQHTGKQPIAIAKPVQKKVYRTIIICIQTAPLIVNGRVWSIIIPDVQDLQEYINLKNLNK